MIRKFHKGIHIVEDKAPIEVSETNILDDEQKQEVMDYLDDLHKAGYGYDKKVEDIKNEFNLSQEDAEIIVSDWARLNESVTHIMVKEDAADNTKSRTESLKLTADYFLGQLRGLVDKVSKEDSEGAKLFFKNANNTLKDLVRQFEDLKANF